MTKTLSDFSHLEPAEKLLIAKYRFRMLSTVLIEVLELTEQTKAFKASRLYELRRSNEAIALLYETIANYEIAQICRLWDDFDPSGFSIPTMIALLEGKEVRNLLSIREPGSVVIEFRLTSAKDMDEFLLKMFDPAVKQAITIAASEQLERVKNYRNKYIAHPIPSTRKERKKSIEEVKRTDIDSLVETAMSIVWVLQVALSLPYSEYPTLRDNFSKTIKPFYASLKYG